MQWQVFLTAGGQQGRTFLKIQGTNFEICPTYFKISQTYFLLKKRLWFSSSYKGAFFTAK